MMKSVTEYLDETARKFPNKIAFLDKNRSITFLELRQEALCVARKIIQQGIIRKPVAVFMNKSVECIVAFIGIAYSGNFYTPIDIKMPSQRIKKIMMQLQPSLIITKKEYSDIIAKDFLSIPVIEYEHMTTIGMDDRLFNNFPVLIDTDVLYILFTSGSTGTPKGVIISHKSVIDYTEWLADTFYFDENTIFGNQAPLCFDNSVLDIYSTLRNGATCVLIPEEKFSFPIKLLEYLQEQRVNTLFWVPSALCLVVNLKALRKRHVDCLQKVLFAGEVMPNKHLNQWRGEYPEVLFANLYGPTEITVDCTAYIVNRDFADDELLPIGRPCRNTDILVLDDKNELVTEPMVRGELCVRGTSLSYGYWNEPEKTRDAFVQNPLQNSYSEIIYRTGDIVEYNDRGELVYLCRKDNQIKHMGHRIELGEIESVVSALDEIKQSCCLYDGQIGELVLFYVGNIAEKAIGTKLAKLLPHYMIPNKMYKLTIMPLNLNGKIDRVELKNRILPSKNNLEMRGVEND